MGRAQGKDSRLMTNPIGCYNSSITRVRPFFHALFLRDPSGKSWLPALLHLARCNQEYATSLAADTGTLVKDTVEKRPYADRILAHYGIKEIALEKCFERSVPPPAGFLKWLIEHPCKMTWPMDGQKKRLYGDKTQRLRTGLIGGDIEAKSAALTGLMHCGVEKSKRKWWAFEGFTEVDCLLETDKLVLFIEGKRTECLSASTDWYPLRNQLVRNLEVARNMAHGRQYAVLVISETALEPLTDTVFTDSLPHFCGDDIRDLKNHFLGNTYWDDVCKAVDGINLPDTTADVIANLQCNGSV